jgi:hypothetical protein
MPPLRLDLREVEYQQLMNEIVSPSTEWSRRQEIQERLDQIREEKDEECKDWELANGISEDSAQNVGDNDDEAHIDEHTETAAAPPTRGGSVEFNLRAPGPICCRNLSLTRPHPADHGRFFRGTKRGRLWDT